MKKWYTVLSGKKTVAAGLAALVVLTCLLTVCFYQSQREKSELLTQQTQEEPSGEAASGENQLAEEINHEPPVGSEVGESLLAQEQPTLPAADNSEAPQADEAAPVAENLHLAAMNLSFDGTSRLQWPVAGRQLIKEYSMDSLVYYATLKEYKVCPAILIQASPNDAVMAPADGLVTEIGANEEIGNYIRLKLGDSYEALIGNMDAITVSVGDYLVRGALLGGVAAPTKYYVTEGPNLYFQVMKDAQPVDPLDYLN